LTIESLGDVVVDRELLRLAGRAGDLTFPMGRILDSLHRTTADQFASEGARGSGGWEPLAASTLDAKARSGIDPRILHATGALERSLTGSGGIADAHPDGFDFGTRVPYAQFHQQGTSRMPARKPVQPTGADRRDWIKEVQNHILGDFNG
jgi:phage gpG-like protein